ncbi:UNVERIFIED_CONTAM: hypothetical protein Slati_3525800 [Sesamum latifolium]|uniref:DUF4218 domain-containing protein n=1 Tax=Sesamum latifolium TaxID=2727402 RepID=A0AAW2UIX2_9LAMI
MLYWKDDVDLEYCKFCGDTRYKPTRGQDPRQKKSPYAILRYLSLTPRLQKLYSSRSTAKHMTWHATHQMEEASLHPSDAEAWKHFDQMYPDFAEEPRNVRLGLYTDGFAPHGQTYDHATDNEFIIRAALMWIVNDLPAYEMASGWSTAGVMGCPICMDETRTFCSMVGRRATLTATYSFSLSNIPTEGIRKFSYGTDHKWTKKSIFLDLPYWSMLLIRHNLDVMHIEKNIFDNIFNTVMDIKGKTKDNLNACQYLKSICNSPELELDERRPNVMPKAAYTLSKEQKMRVCEWIKGLHFPDGYASNLSCCIDMTELQMHGMKSHNRHVFMQKLIPIAFQEVLPEHVWSALTEISLLFQSICSTTLDVHKLHELESSVAIILCNLEKIFPPAFFDSMEHLIVHLPYEACVGGTMQYRWMYPFERFLRELKKKVKNKAHVEASIVEAYIIEEIGLFTHSTLSWACNPNEQCLVEMMSTRTTTMAFKCRFSTILVHPMLNSTENELLKSHYWGPSAEVTSVPCYFVNEYNFQTERHNTGKSNMNYVSLDLSSKGNEGAPRYIIVDVNFKKLYQKDELFILAQQAVQVYFTQYTSLKRDKRTGWLLPKSRLGGLSMNPSGLRYAHINRTKSYKSL